MDNTLIDTLLILSVKLILMFGFIYLMKFWMKKRSGLFPKIIYAIFGIVFVLIISTTIFELFLHLISAPNYRLIPKESINSFSVLCGLGLYFYIGWNVLNIGKA